MTFRPQIMHVARWPCSELAPRVAVHVRRLRSLTMLLLVATCCAANISAHAATYAYTDLGTLGGSWSNGVGINNSGQVVGTAALADSSYQATVWFGSTATGLGTPSNWAGAINNLGHVAGSAGGFATVWSGATEKSLGTPLSGANGINDSGQVVGGAAVPAWDNAMLWSGGTATKLLGLRERDHPGDPVLGVGSSTAYDINNSGLIVGRSMTSAGPEHAVMWSGNTVTDLGVLEVPGAGSSLFSAAYALNDAGQIVGESTIGNDPSIRHATLWDGAVITDLETRGSGVFSQAFGINNFGQVVGLAWLPFGDGRTHATLWNGSVATDLNDFIDEDARSAGWYLYDARGINDGGWITGTARNSITGQEHAYLLAVVPETATYALMLVGLGVLGLVCRRRNRCSLG